MLTAPETILLIIIVTAMLLIISGRLRADLVALMVMIALGISGVLTPDEIISGFAQPVILTLVSLFILARALEDTGVVQRIGQGLAHVGRGSETRLILAVMASAVVLALFMNLVAAAALLLPAVVQAAHNAEVRPSKVLIPLSFGTLLGGTATSLVTANLLMNTLLIEQGVMPLTFFDFMRTGSLIILAGMLYMIIIGRRLLPDRAAVGQQVNPWALTRNLYKTYQLEERMWEFQVPGSSHIANLRLRDSGIGEKLGVTVLAIWRGSEAILNPAPDDVIEAGDYLLILGREDRTLQLCEWGLVLGRRSDDQHPLAPMRAYAVDLTEVVIPPRSTIVGKSLTDLRFRAKYGLTTVALWRGGRSYRTDVGKFPLQVGDALLMVGGADRIRALSQENDYLVLRSGHAARPRVPDKAPFAIAIFALALAASISGLLPTMEAVLAGAVAVVLAGCLNMDEAYRAVEWRVVFLVGGMLPISIALNQTGLAARIGDGIDALVGGGGALALIAASFVLTISVVQFFGSQVTSIIVGPLTIAAALHMGIDPRLIALATGTACSTAFLTPVAHPVNVLMMGPGGYRFGDFARVGLGLTVVVFVVLMFGVVVVWGL